ncbi:Cystathionine gamma-lyase [Sarcoptes scabiei]|nr:Cystathionine gamma-lyase [Sarcoptes scabiei]
MVKKRSSVLNKTTPTATNTTMQANEIKSSGEKTLEDNLNLFDHSIIREPINLGIKNVAQIVHCITGGSREIKDLILNECNVIYECRVCSSLFRSLANFLAHKRFYCKKHCCETMVLFDRKWLDEIRMKKSASSTPEEKAKSIPEQISECFKQDLNERPVNDDDKRAEFCSERNDSLRPVEPNRKKLNDLNENHLDGQMDKKKSRIEALIHKMKSDDQKQRSGDDHIDIAEDISNSEQPDSNQVPLDYEPFNHHSSDHGESNSRITKDDEKMMKKMNNPSDIYIMKQTRINDKSKKRDRTSIYDDFSISDNFDDKSRKNSSIADHCIESMAIIDLSPKPNRRYETRCSVRKKCFYDCNSENCFFSEHYLKKKNETVLQHKKASVKSIHEPVNEIDIEKIDVFDDKINSRINIEISNVNKLHKKKKNKIKRNRSRKLDKISKKEFKFNLDGKLVRIDDENSTNSLFSPSLSSSSQIFSAGENQSNRIPDKIERDHTKIKTDNRKDNFSRSGHQMNDQKLKIIEKFVNNSDSGTYSDTDVIKYNLNHRNRRSDFEEKDLVPESSMIASHPSPLIAKIPFNRFHSISDKNLNESRLKLHLRTTGSKECYEIVDNLLN